MAIRKSRQALDAPTRLDIWQRITRLLAVCALLMGASVGFLYFLPEKEMLDEMRLTNERLTQHRDQLLAQRADKLQLEQESLADPAYLEQIGRDLLNLQLPGETVIRIDRGEFRPSGDR